LQAATPLDSDEPAQWLIHILLANPATRVAIRWSA
jgi:hypothetical protein